MLVVVVVAAVAGCFLAAGVVGILEAGVDFAFLPPFLTTTCGCGSVSWTAPFFPLAVPFLLGVLLVETSAAWIQRKEKMVNNQI